MAEIIRIDQIGVGAINEITGITNFDSKIAFISGQNSTKNLASYHIESNGTLFNGPVYVQKLLGKNILSISSYKHFLLILTDEQKVYVLSDILKHDGVSGISELKVKNCDTNLSDDLMNYLFDPILKITKKCTNICLSLVQLIIVKHNVYFFVQSTCSHLKHKILFVLEGSLYEGNKLLLNESIKLQTFFNLYNNGRINGLSKSESRKIKLSSVCFNECTHDFILLLKYDSKGYLGKIKKYTEFDGMSSTIETFNCVDSLFTLSNSPTAITSLNNNVILLIAGRNDDDLNKYYVIKLL